MQKPGNSLKNLYQFDVKYLEFNKISLIKKLDDGGVGWQARSPIISHTGGETFHARWCGTAACLASTVAVLCDGTRRTESGELAMLESSLQG
jgi:hypothetical protein